VLSGQLEGRGYLYPNFNAKVEEMRRRKRDRILLLLSLDLAHKTIGDKFDFLTAKLNEQAVLPTRIMCRPMRTVRTSRT
jgi:hypothetical protein